MGLVSPPAAKVWNSVSPEIRHQAILNVAANIETAQNWADPFWHAEQAGIETAKMMLAVEAGDVMAIRTHGRNVQAHTAIYGVMMYAGTRGGGAGRPKNAVIKRRHLDNHRTVEVRVNGKSTHSHQTANTDNTNARAVKTGPRDRNVAETETHVVTNKQAKRARSRQKRDIEAGESGNNPDYHPVRNNCNVHPDNCIRAAGQTPGQPAPGGSVVVHDPPAGS